MVSAVKVAWGRSNSSFWTLIFNQPEISLSWSSQLMCAGKKKTNSINIVSTAFVAAFSHSIIAAQNQTTRTSGLTYNNTDEKIAVCFWSSLLRRYSVCVTIRGWKKAGKSSVMCKVHFYCHYTIHMTWQSKCAHGPLHAAYNISTRLNIWN